MFRKRSALIRNDMNIGFYRADSKESLEEAFALVWEEYGKEGYIGADTELKVPPYDFLPTSATFVAKSADAVIGMVTLVGDGENGLPMESIYGKEVAGFRTGGREMAEISQLAIRRDEAAHASADRRRFRSDILLSLFRLVYFFAKQAGIGILCITINPKHESFYEAIGFVRFGELKSYPLVNDAPALAMMLPLPDPDMHSFGQGFVFQEILKHPLTKEDFSPARTGGLIFSIEC